MTTLDPALCARLVGEAREAEKEWDADAANEGKNFLPAHYVEGWNDALEAFALHLADQLEAALAEVGELKLAICRRDADHNEEARLLRAEVARLREVAESADYFVATGGANEMSDAACDLQMAVNEYRKAKP